MKTRQQGPGAVLIVSPADSRVNWVWLAASTGGRRLESSLQGVLSLVCNGSVSSLYMGIITQSSVMANESRTIPSPSHHLPWSLVRGWNGLKLAVALIAIPVWNRREMISQWFYATPQEYWRSGLHLWIWPSLRQLSFLVLLAQLWLLLSVLPIKSTRWRTVLLVAGIVWLVHCSATELGGRGWFTRADPFHHSALWFSFFTVLLAWILWDDERLTLRLILGTALSALLFRLWVFPGIGRYQTHWVMLVFAHVLLTGASMGVARWLNWEWQVASSTTGSSAADRIPPSGQIDERRQFRFVHLMLAVICAAVLVIGVRPETQLHADVKELLGSWLEKSPRDWPVMVGIAIVSSLLSLLGIGAALGRRRWWLLLIAAALVAFACAVDATTDAASLRAALFPVNRRMSSYRWPMTPWPWLYWSLTILFTPTALLAGVRTAGYRWMRPRKLARVDHPRPAS